MLNSNEFGPVVGWKKNSSAFKYQILFSCFEDQSKKFALLTEDYLKC